MGRKKQINTNEPSKKVIKVKRNNERGTKGVNKQAGERVMDDKKKQKTALTLYGKGLSTRFVAWGVGIGKSTLVAYEKDNEKFAVKVKKKQSMWVKRNVDIIEGASKIDYRAATWLLKNAYPDEFGDQKSMKIEVKEVKKYNLDSLSDKQKSKFEEIVLALDETD